VSLRVQIARRAKTQISEINSWWRENRSAAPELFLRELVKCLDLLSRSPRIGHLDPESSVPGVRRLLLVGSQFHVYYRIRAGIVSVIAVWHAKRGSGPPLR
jgi:plasmid stabilization system protein ParE